MTSVRFFAAGSEAAEARGFLTIDGAEQWHGEAGELAEELLERASREVRRNALGAGLSLSSRALMDATNALNASYDATLPWT